MRRAERQPLCYTAAMADEADSYVSGQLRQSEPTVAVGAVVALRLFDVVFVAPAGQGPDDWPESTALLGQHVLVAASAGRRLGQHPLIDEE